MSEPANQPTTKVDRESIARAIDFVGSMGNERDPEAKKAVVDLEALPGLERLNVLRTAVGLAAQARAPKADRRETQEIALKIVNRLQEEGGDSGVSVGERERSEMSEIARTVKEKIFGRIVSEAERAGLEDEELFTYINVQVGKFMDRVGLRAYVTGAGSDKTRIGRAGGSAQGEQVGV